MEALHVSVIVTRDSSIVSSELHRVELDFADGADAIMYVDDLLPPWLAACPTPGAERVEPAEAVVERYDVATELAARLDEILHARDGALFPAPDPEAIASEAEGRPYDGDAWAAPELNVFGS